ncbi:cobalamin B12-binding domain-containing protein [Hymenobacter jejuensis]|uniref:B12-binding domain-containing protein n=1 Tax=Hymenobacter jejuensis TaxID=2502781 RepID=A0A5B7ZVP7_9BACT|nr:cobalamin-dependent protein [Hymenobacter jejuensis]QDA58655.1 hypothetical protein FHG12_00420 [Hymenobacter jejuensis]
MPKTPVRRQHIAQQLYAQAPTVAVTAAGLYEQYASEAGVWPPRPRQEYNVGQSIQHLCRPLADSVLMDSQSLLEGHLEHERHLSPGPSVERDAELRAQLGALKQVLSQRLPINDYILTASYLNSAITHLTVPVSARAVSPKPLVNPHWELAAKYLNLLLAGNRTDALTLIRQEAKRGTDVRDLYVNVFQETQRKVGNLWHEGAISVAQEHYCTAATELAMALVHPYLMNNRPTQRRLLATTLSGDLHSMPVRIVSDFLEGDGWDAYFLGASTPINSIWPAMIAQRADLLVVGASMGHHVVGIRELIQEKEKYPECARMKVMVGGAPFNEDPELWKAVGADAYAADARQAVEVARELFVKAHSSSKSRPNS